MKGFFHFLFSGQSVEEDLSVYPHPDHLCIYYCLYCHIGHKLGKDTTLIL